MEQWDRFTAWLKTDNATDFIARTHNFPLQGNAPLRIVMEDFDIPITPENIIIAWRIIGDNAVRR